MFECWEYRSIGRASVVVLMPSIDIECLPNITFVGIPAGVRFVSVSGVCRKGCRDERQFLRNMEDGGRPCSFFLLASSP